METAPLSNFNQIQTKGGPGSGSRGHSGPKKFPKGSYGIDHNKRTVSADWLANTMQHAYDTGGVRGYNNMAAHFNRTIQGYKVVKQSSNELQTKGGAGSGSRGHSSSKLTTHKLGNSSNSISTFNDHRGSTGVLIHTNIGKTNKPKLLATRNGPVRVGYQRANDGTRITINRVKKPKKSLSY